MGSRRPFFRGAGIFAAMVLPLLTAACGGPVETVPLAYVAVAGNNHIQVIDLESGETLRKIYAGATPWRLEVSPDGGKLLAQHWYTAYTAVIDLATHEIEATLPVRGPAIFTPRGDRVVAFSWPSATLQTYETQSWQKTSEKVTEMKQVYDLDATPDGDTLYLAQADPMTQPPARVYGYILSYEWKGGEAELVVPDALRTGSDPQDITVLRSQPFLLTADHQTNGLSLLNWQKDGRAVPTCPAPETVLVSPDETRMFVACWRGGGLRTSQVLRYVTDFSQRPWPAIHQEGNLTVEGGVVAGTLSPAGDKLYLVDRSGKRLLEVEPETLQVQRSFPTGDEPMDVVVVEVPKGVRDRLAEGESPARRTAREAIAKLREASAAFDDLSWTETTIWYEPDPEAVKEEDAAAEGEDAGEEEHAAEGEGEEEGEEEEPALIEKRRQHKLLLKGPAWLRTETEDGDIRLAQGGRAASLDQRGFFWVTARQELVSVVYTVPNMTVDEALRQLTGDVPGSPFLRAGLALDMAEEVEEGGHRTYVLGATAAGGRTAQLWVDADSGRPVNLVEQVPSFGSRAHGGDEGFSGIIETRFADFQDLGDGHWLPTRLERLADGQFGSEVMLEDIQVNGGLADELFALDRLGGLGPEPPPVIEPVPTREVEGQPGRAVPVLQPDYLEHPRQPHPPYNSSPPTSGPRVRELADWGLHDVPIPLELQAHNLEHGGILVQYNCPEGCPELVDKLTEIVIQHDQMILAPYPLMSSRIALTAWGRIDTFDELDRRRIERFITAYAGQDHHVEEEPGAQAAH